MLSRAITQQMLGKPVPPPPSAAPVPTLEVGAARARFVTAPAQPELDGAGPGPLLSGVPVGLMSVKRDFPSFQPGFRMPDGTDLIKLAGIVIGNENVVASITTYGGVGDGVTDNTAAFLNALANSSVVTFPPGVFYFSAGVVWTMPAGAQGLTIVGSGVDVTVIKCGGEGWNITLPTISNSINVSNMSFVTDQAGVANGLVLYMDLPDTQQPAYSMNTLQNLVFYGSDGYRQLNYWNFAIYTTNVTNINFINVQITGPANDPASPGQFAGIGVSINGSSTPYIGYAVVFNFVNCYFNGLAYGFLYGSYVQGVTFTSCNFICNTGIYVGPTVIGQDQLSVVNCQFGMFPIESIGIQGGFGNLIDFSCVGSLFEIAGPNSFGISAYEIDGFTCVGCIFRLFADSLVGIFITESSTFENGVIAGNQFLGSSSGSIIDSTGIGFGGAIPGPLILGQNYFGPFLQNGISGEQPGDVGMVVQYNTAPGTYEMKKVTAGAPDSGGAGFRALVVPN